MNTLPENQNQQQFHTFVRINNLNELNQVRNHITKHLGLTIKEDVEDNNDFVSGFEGIDDGEIFVTIYSTKDQYQEIKSVNLLCELDDDLEGEDPSDMIDLEDFLQQKDLYWTTTTESKPLQDTEMDKVFQTLVPCKNQEQFEKILDHLEEIGLKPYEDPNYDFEECINFIESGNDSDSDFYDPENTVYVLIYASGSEYFDDKMVRIAVTSSYDLEEDEEDETVVGYFEFLENESLDWF